MEDEKDVGLEEEVVETVDDVTDDATDNDDPQEDQQEAQETPKTYTQDEVEAIIKKRVATFNRKLDKSKSYQQALERMSQITGLDIPNLLSRLEGLTDAEQAKILGITPEQAAQRRKDTQQSQATTTQNQELQRKLEEKELLLDQRFKDLPLFREEIYDLLDDNPKLTMKQAYLLAKGDAGTQAAVRDAEQRAVARMTKSSNQQVVKPGATVKQSGPKIDANVVSAAKKVGMDPNEYAAFAQIDSLDSYLKLKESKKK